MTADELNALELQAEEAVKRVDNYESSHMPCQGCDGIFGDHRESCWLKTPRKVLELVNEAKLHAEAIEQIARYKQSIAITDANVRRMQRFISAVRFETRRAISSPQAKRLALIMDEYDTDAARATESDYSSNHKETK